MSRAALACRRHLPRPNNWVRGEIDSVSWFATGVTYVLAIGLVSNSSAILIVSLLGAAALAFLYGVNMELRFAALHEHPPHIDDKPFLEV